MDLLTQAREIAYQGDQAQTDWSMIEVMGRDWRAESQDTEPIAAAYLSDHLPSWRHLARVEGAHPWLALEARILAQPTLPVPIHERSEPDSIRAACAQWRAALEGAVTLDEDGRWRLWLCAWVMGFVGYASTLRWIASFIQKSGHLVVNHKTYIKIKDCWILGIDFDGKIWGAYSPTIWNEKNNPLDMNANLGPFTPKTVAQAAQQCLIRIPDRILTCFKLRRWQTSLGFEV